MEAAAADVRNGGGRALRLWWRGLALVVAVEGPAAAAAPREGAKRSGKNRVRVRNELVYILEIRWAPSRPLAGWAAIMLSHIVLCLMPALWVEVAAQALKGHQGGPTLSTIDRV
jgi:hypothetical protein